MRASLIVAMDKNRVIGKEKDIPWRIPKDWEYVKNITKGYPIILGRKNLESIRRALPDRRSETRFKITMLAATNLVVGLRGKPRQL